MARINDYGNYETAWCPGCGNFSILEAIKKALAASSLEPRDVLLVSGIGQAAKTPHYLNANVFNGLHGRALPVATGAKLANTQLTVLVTSGDGCSYGEGGNHLLAAIRRNINITLLVHNNQIYGLTKGQASPTSPEGFITKAQPQGTPSGAFNPIAVAIALKAGFVARGFSGRIDHLSYLIKQGIAHKGFSLIDILQPCVSFNKINTFAWYDSRCYNLPSEYDPADWDTAIKTGHEWGDKIPLGIIYKNNRPSFESHFPILKQGPLYRQTTNKMQVNGIMDGYR
ncbi:MAG: 2-oxoacid:ferredoxin oxidoreductase subunit beta [Deltaproteobacteria bacterium]|nr:2-oxoacid:ferredoxin oxidoreductase subunit beta [Deltaproteobacteria bacterium]